MITTSEIFKALREESGLTQDEVAIAMGISRPTYIAIENGKKDLTLTEIKRLAAIFKVSPSDIVGDVMPELVSEENIEKYKQIILNALHYGSGSDGKITKTKLAKLAYLADFAWYYMHQKPMSGMVYRRIQQGPVPDQYFRVIDEMYESGQLIIEAKKCNGGSGTAMLISESESTPPVGKLKKEEISLIQKIADKWKDKNTTDIVNFTHEQLPWKICRPGELIPYELIGQEDLRNVY
jgi:transcriptional regulator with XRE-family HTH domain